MDAQGLCDTDAVCDLHHCSLAESVGHQVLGDPPSSIGSRPVDLGWVLARESTSSVSSPTSVSISDDLPSSQPSVSSRSTNDEQVAGVEHVASVDEPLLRDCVLDDVIDEILSELLVGDVWVVLCADEDGVDSYWCDEVALFFVLDCNLHLGVRTHPGQDLLLPALLQPPHQGSREVVAERHEVLSLIRGVSDHQPLVSSTHLLF